MLFYNMKYMKRIKGYGLLVECINPRFQKYIIRWDVKPFYRKDEETGEEVQQGYDYFEKWLNHKPTIEEVKEIVLNGMNEIIDQRILEGFEWAGMKVWLSTENQFNYKAAYDLAVQTQGASLPVTFKFGTTEEPVYYEFKDLQSFTDFYTQAMGYINYQLAEGWKEKDSVDWKPYEELLNK